MSIGLEIAIAKTREDGGEVEYAFRVHEGRGGLAVSKATGQPGRVKISRTTGEVTLLEGCPDEIAGGLLFARVSSILKRHWKNGEYPNTTSWVA
jgi:hypothetical protein